jgi:hypothetical protein
MTNWHEYPTNFGNGTIIDGPASFFMKYPVSQVPMMGNLLIVLLWVTAFSLSMAGGVRKAFGVASFITLTLAIYLWRLSMIDISVLFILLVLGVVGVLGGKEENL